MSSVFIVTEGRYDNYHIEGVFSTKDKAMAYIARWKRVLTEAEREIFYYEYHEWEIDKEQKE